VARAAAIPVGVEPLPREDNQWEKRQKMDEAGTILVDSAKNGSPHPEYISVTALVFHEIHPKDEEYVKK
jgi:hypothetical protein